MSFWDLEDGGSALDTGKDFDAGGGGYKIIPDGSSVLAVVDEVKWAEKNGSEYVNVRWSVLEPAEFENAKIFQKLWLTDPDPGAKTPEKAAQKRDKAKRMLIAMDNNASGKLTKLTRKPSDDDLSASLCNRPMVIRVHVWEVEDRMTGEKIQGNWVAAVAPKNSGTSIKDAPKAEKPSGFGAGGRPASRDLDDEIPFAPAF